MNNIITLKAVTKHYGDLKAVDNVSFAIEEGKILALLGPSGCGKTTTLRLLAGLERPDAGEIRLGDRLVYSGRTWVAPEDRRVGLVFQDYALFPHLSVGQNIVFGLNGLNNDEKHQRMEQMLKLVGLAGLDKRMPHMLSGGQQQRVALARALAPQPKVILLDEPFSNLDAALRSQVRTEVRNILEETGITSIFVTHDQEEALSLGDQIAVMFDGRVAQLGTPQEIYIRPASREVAQFVGEANFIPGEAQGDVADSEIGQIPLVDAAQGKVDLLIRPEAITLTSNNADATVEWVEFFGHDQRISVKMDSGIELIVRADAWQQFTPGQQVGVKVNHPAQAFRV